MKKKRIIGLITLFMCVALVGVGFAAWVITGDATHEQSGNVQVEKVTDERLKIKAVTLSNSNIVFGKNSTSTTNHWLKNDGIATEVLTTELSFTVENNKQCTGVDISLEPSAECAEAYQKAIDDKIIIAPEFEAHQAKKEDEGDATYTYTLTWKWGTEFSLDGETAGKNPFEFYNTYTGEGKDIDNSRKKEGKSNADYALAALQKLYTLNEASFKITITATSTANAA